MVVKEAMKPPHQDPPHSRAVVALEGPSLSVSGDTCSLGSHWGKETSQELNLLSIRSYKQRSVHNINNCSSFRSIYAKYTVVVSLVLNLFIFPV